MAIYTKFCTYENIPLYGNTSEDDMLEALMQLLPWVSASDSCSVCVCMASCVRIWCWKEASLIISLNLSL